MDLNLIDVLQLTNSFDFVIIDREDKEKCLRFNWSRHIRDGQIYRTSHRLGRKPIKLSRFITGELWRDHANRNKLDNRKENLRKIPEISFNCINKDKISRKCSSKYKGVSFHSQSGRWSAYVNYNGKRYSLKTYHTEEEAALAYNKKAKELFGEFAVMNII